MSNTQANRPLEVITPLGKDVLLLESFAGQEGISRLYNFQLEMIAENKTNIAFDRLLGQKITVRLNVSKDKKRFFNGICTRVSQGERDTVFTRYGMEIVPELWRLTKIARSRIFQRKNVPDILKKVLEGLDVKFEINGTFHPRDYCVQYRETDFNFASRLMEEEGIFYFFTHSEKGHQLVVANTPQSHPDMPIDSKLIYEDVQGGVRDEGRVFDWQKTQEWRSGKYTLWDHCFELPHKHLEAEANIVDTVQVGTVSHKVKVNGNDRLEIYDFPGEYAQRFDGINSGGGEQPAELQKIFQDNRRTTDIRIEEESVPGLVIHGASNCRQFVAGHKFNLQRHFNADGAYVVTGVSHSANQGGFRSDGAAADFRYSNSFTCIPQAMPYRPQRSTPKPVVQGTQTAVVVGPSGEEIFTDKYGRVKVQFHWDREGKNNEESSCWIRVGTLWAGKQWGVIHIPRIDQEVVVAFLEGDPDQPIIIGSVYNAREMPPYELPTNKTRSGIKSRSSLHGTAANFNEIRFEDKKGQEEVYVHAERNLRTMVEADESRTVQGSRDTKIGIGGLTPGDDVLTVGKDRSATITMNDTETVGMNQSITVGMSQSTTVGISQSITVGATITITAGGMVTINAPMIALNAPIVSVAGIVQCQALVTNSVVSPVYTPGVGNLL